MYSISINLSYYMSPFNAITHVYEIYTTNTYTYNTRRSVRLSVRDTTSFSIFLLSLLYVNIKYNLSLKYSKPTIVFFFQTSRIMVATIL